MRVRKGVHSTTPRRGGGGGARHDRPKKCLHRGSSARRREGCSTISVTPAIWSHTVLPTCARPWQPFDDAAGPARRVRAGPLADDDRGKGKKGRAKGRMQRERTRAHTNESESHWSPPAPAPRRVRRASPPPARLHLLHCPASSFLTVPRVKQRALECTRDSATHAASTLFALHSDVARLALVVPLSPSDSDSIDLSSASSLLPLPPSPAAR